MFFRIPQMTWNRLRNHRITQTIPYWIAAVMVGFLATGYAILFNWISKFSSNWFSEFPWLIFIIAPAAFLIGWLLVIRFAPAAAGSGIPQVLAAIELSSDREKEIRGLLRIRVAVVKIVSSFFCLLGGGAIGREGPTLQISASIFNFVGNRVRKIWPDTDHRSWIVAGGAAGIASAFNTPLGGIVYAIEELSSVHFYKFKMTALSAVIVSGLISQAVLGTYLYLGYPNVPSTGFDIIPLVLFVGLVSGSAGACFGKSLFQLSNMIRLRVIGQKKIFVPLVSGLLLASLYFFVDRRSIGSGSEINSDLLFGGEGHSSLALIFSRFASSLLSYLSGCAGGIFAPSLSIGASIGAEISKFLGNDQQNILILSGMVGFLTAVTHCPFTSVVLILEMTDHHSAIFPLMAAALVAQGVAFSFDSKSFYEKAKIFYLPADMIKTK
ncbi:MAG: hypothetical protein JWQ35_2422 [Bacteriovoracaceae bacterium]|nr:hypothetical protein [Bacteriovoracaceae bacterium]